MEYKDFLKILDGYKNENKALFSKRILNTNLKCLGIMTPQLKELAKTYKDISFENFAFDEVYEVVFLYFYISLSRLTKLEDQIDFIYKNFQYIDTWSITDQTVQLLRKPNIETFINLIKEEELYLKRYGYVGLLKYSKDEYFDKVIKIFKKDERYYVNMAEGWLLSYLFINCFEKTIKFVENNSDLKEISLIGIQKAIDSRRINDEQRAILRDLRSKIKNL